MKGFPKDRNAWRKADAPGGRWRRLLWALVFPSRAQRVSATVPGVVLVVLAVGVGVAAYNSSSNILYVTLSLLLGCLILSGVLSWLNFRNVRWRVEADVPMRVGREHVAKVHLRNDKRVLPSAALVFEVVNTSSPEPRALALRDRLDPGCAAELAWSVKPERRGWERVELAYVGSLFPFGFLRKSLAANVGFDAMVWPAPIEYRRHPVLASRRLQPGAPVAKAGQSGDLLALRNYRNGDSHRQIHWKASARLGRLVVRQFSADTEENFSIWLSVSASVWRHAGQFEKLCSLAATLAEDLFKQGRLECVAIGGEPPIAVRGVRDLEAFLDRVAVLDPDSSGDGAAQVPPALRNLLSFAPEGSYGVMAHVDGETAATA